MSKIKGKEWDAKKLFSAVQKYKYVLVMIVFGVSLMLLPSFGEKKGQEEQEESTAYSLYQTQEEMSRILSQIEGVGRVSVMLTVSSNGCRIYQNNRELSYRGAVQSPEDYNSVNETVLLNRGSGGQEALMTQELYPDYVGALIVCDGAGDSGTVLKIKEAVSALTGLGADRITVARRSANQIT